MKTVFIDMSRITDQPSFHEAFQSAMGFPAFYGANMDAWIDCMSAVDEPEAGLSAVTVSAGQLLLLELAEAIEFAGRCPDIYQDLIESTIFVNRRRAESGRWAVLALLLRR